jgi:hypothetical protein
MKVPRDEIADRRSKPPPFRIGPARHSCELQSAICDLVLEFSCGGYEGVAACRVSDVVRVETPMEGVTA